MSGLGVPYIPLDITEFGFIYAADRESWRATQMTALGDVLSRSNCGVRITAPYDWINPSGTPDWGLVDPAGTTSQLRPAGTSWFSAFAQGGTEPTLATCLPAGGRSGSALCRCPSARCAKRSERTPDEIRLIVSDAGQLSSSPPRAGP